MGWLSWIVFGALAGGVAGMIVDSKRSGCLYNVVIGIVGAFVGGFLMQFITERSIDFGFNLSSFVVAVLGAIVLLLITGAARKK